MFSVMVRAVLRFRGRSGQRFVKNFDCSANSTVQRLLAATDIIHRQEMDASS